MPSRVFCPVCRVSFLHNGEISAGVAIICPVCGAKLRITEASRDEHLVVERYPDTPDNEIRERIETYARLRGFRFSEERESIIEGLIEKHRKHGDFYCPCKFDNVPENICPCLETRSGYVLREGKCY